MELVNVEAGEKDNVFEVGMELVAFEDTIDDGTGVTVVGLPVD